VPVCCPTIEDLQLLQDGRLPTGQVEVLARHVEQCARCVETLQQIGGNTSLAGSIGLDNTDVHVDHLIDRLKGLLSREGGTSIGERAAAALEPPRGPDEIGRLGNYRVLKVLGSGGMGVVYLARDTRLPRLVAVKTILAGHHPSPERLARFRREAESVARLQHPNVVQLYEVGEHQGQPFLAMEYVGGGNLAGRLADRVLAARPAAELIEALARALQTAHDAGIIHRDLKPANVLLQEEERTTNHTNNTNKDQEDNPETAEGSSASSIRVIRGSSLLPKLADFGLAKYLDEEGATQPGTVLGTPGYMAPEQIESGGADVGPATDVYGLGAVLYECLTGRPPFRAATPLETLDLVRSREPLPPRQLNEAVPADLETICLKCLHKEPGRRYASARDLADELGRFLRGEPIHARPVSSLERLMKWVRRKPAAAALAAFSLVVPVLVLAGVLVHNARLKEAAAEARRQQQLARDAYKSARDTLEEMLKQFASLRTGAVPQVRELQRRQAEKALAFYESAFDDQDNPDPVIRLDTAVACKRAADLQSLLGRPAQAEENYTRAIGLLEGLPAEDRDAPANVFLLALCHNHRGLITASSRRWEEGALDHNRALRLIEAMAQSNPRSENWRAMRADTEHFLGALYQSSGKYTDAEPHLRRSASFHAELVRERPDMDGYLAKLADTEINLALICQQKKKRTAEAIVLSEQAESHLRSLLKRHPADGEYSLSLGALYCNWGLLLDGEGHHRAAIAKLAQAIELTEGVLKQEPKHWTARFRAFNAHGARAQLYEHLDRWADAVRDWDRVVELEVRPEEWLNRALRALALARAGMHARAAAEAKALSSDPHVSTEGVYGLACVWALSAGKVKADVQLDATRRKVLSDEYAGQAIDLLRRLHSQGYFKDAAHAKALATDPDLEVLRKRSDFQKLLPRPEVGNK
jgi:serine/threonine protein kinase